MKVIKEWRFQGWNKSFLIYKDEHAKKYGIKSRLGHDIMPCVFADLNWFTYDTDSGPNPQKCELVIFEMNNKQAMCRYSKLMEKVPEPERALLELCAKHEVVVESLLPPTANIQRRCISLRNFTPIKEHDIITIPRQYKYLYHKIGKPTIRTRRYDVALKEKEEDVYVPCISVLLNREGVETYTLISPGIFHDGCEIADEKGLPTGEYIHPSGTVIDAFYNSQLQSWDEIIDLLIDKPFEVTYKRIRRYSQDYKRITPYDVPQFNFVS